MMLTQEKLKTKVHYDPETGLFTWICAVAKHVKAGDIAGFYNNKGYLVIKLEGRDYKAHRLAWLYVYGDLPDCFIDHINCVKGDNRISNLRLANDSQNKLNTFPQKNNSSGYKGVSKHRGRWRIQARIEGITYQLGIFDDVHKAAEAYASFAKDKHGDFARV